MPVGERCRRWQSRWRHSRERRPSIPTRFAHCASPRTALATARVSRRAAKFIRNTTGAKTGPRATDRRMIAGKDDTRSRSSTNASSASRGGKGDAPSALTRVFESRSKRERASEGTGTERRPRTQGFFLVISRAQSFRSGASGESHEEPATSGNSIFSPVVAPNQKAEYRPGSSWIFTLPERGR